MQTIQRSLKSFLIKRGGFRLQIFNAARYRCSLLSTKGMAEESNRMIGQTQRHGGNGPRKEVDKTPVTDKEGLPQVHIQERSEHERKHQRGPLIIDTF